MHCDESVRKNDAAAGVRVLMLLREREDTLLGKLRLMLRREERTRKPDPDYIAELKREIERLVQQFKERPKAR